MGSMPSAAISVACESSPVVGGTARSRTQDALQVQADTPRPFVPPVRFNSFSLRRQVCRHRSRLADQVIVFAPLITNTGWTTSEGCRFHPETILPQVWNAPGAVISFSTDS